MKVYFVSLYHCTSTKDLCQEQDQQPSTVFTSQLKQWLQKGGGENVAPQPVMEIEVNKTKVDEPRARSGIKPLLYDLRRKTNHSKSAERKFRTEQSVQT